MPRPGACCWAAWRSWSSCSGPARATACGCASTWPRWTPEIKEFFIAFGAVTVGAASIVIAPFIDTFIASYLPTGSRTALYYADRINQLPLGVLGIALGTVLLPEMSARLAQRRSRRLGRGAEPRAALTPAADLALHGRVPGHSRHHHARGLRAWRLRHAAPPTLAAMALAAYGAGLPAMALVRIVQSTFYARHDTMTPARATVTAIVGNIALKVMFVWGLHLGVAGMALGTALGAWINVGAADLAGPQPRAAGDRAAFSCSALPPALLAALAGGAGAWIGAGWRRLLPGAMAISRRWRRAMLLRAASAMARVVLLFRRRLPLGRARMRLFVALVDPRRRGAVADADAGRRAGRALAERASNCI